MTIQNRVRLSLGALLLLLVLVGVAGFMGSRVVGSLANYYATGLVPGVTNYGDIWVSAEMLKLHVYQQEFDTLDETLANARQLLQFLAATTKNQDTPVAQDQDVRQGIRQTVALMEQLISAVEACEPGEPITEDWRLPSTPGTATPAPRTSLFPGSSRLSAPRSTTPWEPSCTWWRSSVTPQ